MIVILASVGQRACHIHIFTIFSQFNIKSAQLWKSIRLRMAISPQVWADPRSSQSTAGNSGNQIIERTEMSVILVIVALHDIPSPPQPEKSSTRCDNRTSNRGLLLPQHQSAGPDRHRWHSQEGLSKPPAQRCCYLSTSQSKMTSPCFLWNCRSTKPAMRKKRN